MNCDVGGATEELENVLFFLEKSYIFLPTLNKHYIENKLKTFFFLVQATKG